MSIIPYGKHYIDQDDIKIYKVLKSNNLTQGPIMRYLKKNLHHM